MERKKNTCSQCFNRLRFDKGKTMNIENARTSCIVALSDASRFNSRRSIFLSLYFFSCFSRKVKTSLQSTDGRSTRLLPTAAIQAYEGPVRNIMIQTCWRRLCGYSRQRAHLVVLSDNTDLFIVFFSSFQIVVIPLVSNAANGTRDNWHTKFFHWTI